MKVLHRLLRGLKIKYKLILCYWPIVSLLVILVGIAVYFSASNAVREQSILIVEQSSSRFANKISQQMKSYEDILDSVTADDDFRRYAQGEYANSAEEYRLHKQFSARMEAVLTAMDSQVCLAVIRYDETLNESLSGGYHRKFPDYLQITSMSSNFQLVNRRRLAGREWFDEIYNAPELVRGLWKQVEEDSLTHSITLFHELTSVDLFTIPLQKIALVEMTVPLEKLISFEADTVLAEPVQYAVMGPKGLLYAEGTLPEKEIYTAYEQRNEGQVYLNDHLYLSKEIPQTDFVLISAVSQHSLKASGFPILRIVLLAIFICSILILIISYIIARTFSDRITILCDSMLKLQKGELGTQLPSDGGADEINYLMQSFNQMSKRIKALVEDVYLANLAKKEADLRTLQAQINPHFLYNSLATIIRLSELKRNEDINTLVRAMVRFYRMSLNHSGDVITLREEFDLVEAYLRIYKIRMGEYFVQQIQLDPSLYQIPVLPLTIQPFVENIFHHALKDDGEKVSIRITAQKSQHEVRIIVEDDGVGMDAQQLDLLLKPPKAGGLGGYGAYNVAERIKLYFGKQFGVTAQSSPNTGTRITIRIPAESNP